MKYLKNIKIFLFENILTKDEILPHMENNFPREIINLINKDFINYLYELKETQFPELNCRIILKLNSFDFLETGWEDDEIILLMGFDHEIGRAHV